MLIFTFLTQVQYFWHFTNRSKIAALHNCQDTLSESLSHTKNGIYDYQLLPFYIIHISNETQSSLDRMLLNSEVSNLFK